MFKRLANFLFLTGKTTRSVYFVTGVFLFFVKYAIDWLIASKVFGREWSPLRYLFWPDRDTVQIHHLAPDDQQFAITILCIAIPFIYIGVTLTIRRLRDADLPVAFVITFFVPFVNLVYILILCLIPSRTFIPPPDSNHNHVDHKRVLGGKSAKSFLFASLFSAFLAVALVVFSANFLKSYGFGIFVGAPFGIGWLATTLYCIPKRRKIGECLLVSFSAIVFTSIALVLIAIEGLICLIMAAPLCIPIALFGSICGYAMQMRKFENNNQFLMILTICLSLPAMIAAEAYSGKEPQIQFVRTEVIIDAPANIVWKYVIEFPPLDEPKDFLFRTGIAYPQRAEIQGVGVGAIRLCFFSTGPFVEPITTWNEPHLLAFDVDSQPAPMEELSPFHIHPPHLNNFLVSKRGQFRLEPLIDGKTRLEGTTWYTNRMWPAEYWSLCSDAIIGRIHRRVLEHVRLQAENETRNTKR